jgi:hypothetical protein
MRFVGNRPEPEFALFGEPVFVLPPAIPDEVLATLAWIKEAVERSSGLQKLTESGDTPPAA